MDSNMKRSEFRNFRENRKRAGSSDILSPRTLFRNIKIKRFGQEEEQVTKFLNNSKNNHGWKPPIKVDSNKHINKFSSHDCHMETLHCSFQDYETNLSQDHNFIGNDPHSFGSNENLCATENDQIDYHEESDEPFPGTSKGTAIYNKDYNDQNNLTTVQNLDSSEEDICDALDNYINNSDHSSEEVAKQDPDILQLDSKTVQKNGKLLQALVETLELSDNNNNEYLKSSFQELNSIKLPSPSKNGINFENQIYDPIDTLSQDTVKLGSDNLEENIDTETHYKDDNQEYSEKSDSSRSTIELGADSKKFLIEHNEKEKKNVLPIEIKHENSDKQTQDFYVKRGMDDLFVKNFQILPTENQILKASNEIENSSRPLINNLETITKYCTSLMAQTEWQRNVLKSITRDIDELNQTVVNATAALRSLQKENTSAN